MPIVNISIAEGRSSEQVAAMIREVTTAVSSTIAAPPEAIKVIVTEVALTHWGSAGQTLAAIRATPPA